MCGADKENLYSFGLSLDSPESEATEKEQLQNLNSLVTSCPTTSERAVETRETNGGESDEAETPKRALLYVASKE